MANCNRDHQEIQDVMKEIPIDQSGIGRHKCAACAYEKGYTDGSNKVLKIDLETILTNIDISQAGTQRHRSAHLAYIKGYFDGLTNILNQNIIDNENHEEEKDYDEEILKDENIAEEVRYVKDCTLDDLRNHLYRNFESFNDRNLSEQTKRKLYANGVRTIGDVYKLEVIPQYLSHLSCNEFRYLYKYIMSLDMDSVVVSKQNADESAIEDLRLLGEEGRRLARTKYMQLVLSLRGRPRTALFSTPFEDFYKMSDLTKIKGAPQNRNGRFYVEIRRIRDTIETYVKELLHFQENNSLTWTYFYEVLNLSAFSDDTQRFYKDYYQANGHLPFLKILEDSILYLAQNDNECSAFISVHSSNSDAYHCKHLALSSERKRQLANSFADVMRHTNREDISNAKFGGRSILFTNPIYSSYFLEKLDNKGGGDIINKDDIEQLMIAEGCNTIDYFIIFKILHNLHNEKYELLGDFLEDDLFKDSYLVKRELSDYYDFSGAIDYFRVLSEKSHIEEITIDINEFFINQIVLWKKEYDSSLCQRIKVSLKTLLFEELNWGQFINDDIITLPPNAQKKIIDIIYDILGELGHEAKPEEIKDIMDREYPDRQIDVSSIKTRMLADTRFVNTKFENKFDLVERNPVVGTYRDLAKIILEESELPLSIDEIYERLPERRKGNIRSFTSNFEMWDESIKFVGNLWGLRDKDYGEDYIPDFFVNSHHDKLAMVLNFIREKKRLPNDSDGEHYYQMSRWVNNLPRRHSHDYQKLMAEVEKVNNPVARQQNILYNECREFINANHRLPLSTTTDENERRLGTWIERLKAGYRNETLDEADEEMYKELIKLNNAR